MKTALKTGLIVATMAVMAGCASSGRVDSVEAELDAVNSRLDAVEQSTQRIESKVDQALEKIDRMSSMTYSK